MTIIDQINYNIKLFGSDPAPNTIIISNQLDDHTQVYIARACKLRVIIAENLDSGEMFNLAFIRSSNDSV